MRGRGVLESTSNNPRLFLIRNAILTVADEFCEVGCEGREGFGRVAGTAPLLFDWYPMQFRRALPGTDWHLQTRNNIPFANEHCGE